MSKQIEALKLALKALEHEAETGNDDAYRRERDAIREALADSALERIAENERELGLDYMETEQPAQQQEPIRVPVTDNTYGYAKSLAEAIFKQHFASDEHYASGRIVWGVNDTVIGILTQIDNMVADMVRRPAQQQEPEKDWGAIGQAHLVALKKSSRELVEEAAVRVVHKMAQQQEPVAWMWKDGTVTTDPDRADGTWAPLYTSPPASKLLVGLTDEEIIEVIHPLVMADMADEATDYEIARAIEAKLKEKNNG